MKSPLGKLGKGLRLHRSGDAKDKRDFLPSAQLDELAQAAQDMLDMRNCYDSLLSAAAATANSAYEFSESLREMGSCLLERTALHDDEESGKVLLILGKVQFELQKLVDSYRSHIFLTITNPSESLLNELRTVEDMKRQCDEKRGIYEYMLAQNKEKGRSKSGKGEHFTAQKLQTAHDEFHDEATLCVFRLKSLKQGQSRSLLTQAARHHAAQLNFFGKGLKSLETVDPHVRLVAEQQHIDYLFRGLEDDVREEDDDEVGGSGNDSVEGRELSFDYRDNKQEHNVGLTSGNSMEVDWVELSFPQPSTSENAEFDIDKSHGSLQVPMRETRASSYSAPIFPARKSDVAERIRQMHLTPTKKSSAYVLPTPIDAKGLVPSRTIKAAPQSKFTDQSGRSPNLWHSSPLELKKHEKNSGDGQFSSSVALKARSTTKETSSGPSNQLPPPLLAFTQLDAYNRYDNKKFERLSFSGPITDKHSSNKPAYSTSGPILLSELPQQIAGLLSRTPIPQSTSPSKVSPSTSPPLVSSPRISELHELPRPPGNTGGKSAKSSVPVGHSAPLVRNPEPGGTSKILPTATNMASPLPIPPSIVPRSFSIPSSNQRAATVHVSRILECPPVRDKAEEVESPQLMPISLANIKSTSGPSELVSHSRSN